MHLSFDELKNVVFVTYAVLGSVKRHSYQRVN